MQPTHSEHICSTATRPENSFFLVLFGLTLSILLSGANLHGQLLIDMAPEFNISGGSTGGGFGTGVNFVDVNGDGLDDLTIVNTADSLRLFLSTGDGFVQAPSPIYCPNGIRHLLWVDYDNDGDLDIYFTVNGGVNRLFRNNGDFTFEDVTLSAGLPLESAINYGASFGDYDRDGHLDLYICRYYSWESNTGKTNKLYRNNGDGTFTDMTEELDVGDGFKPSFMGVWIDINNNSYPDLFVINDRIPGNTLFRNNGDGTFTDITNSSGTSFPFHDPMSATVGDFNNDGYLDIFMSNGGSNINMPPLLMVNNGDETFTESAAEMNIHAGPITWGGVWVDYDNDGWQDLFFCASDLIPNFFFTNNLGLYFNNEGSLIESPVRRSYTCAKGDFNDDGYEDIVVHNRAPEQPIFLMNTGGSNHYIKFTLAGTVSNSQATGTWVRIYRGSETYHKYTLCGENFKGQDSRTLNFGLGSDNQALDSVVVTYPSGHVDTYHGLDIDQTHHFTEGENYTVSIDSQGILALCVGDSVVLDAGDHHTYLWNTGEDSRFITAYPGESYEVTVTSVHGITAVDQLTIEALPPVSVEATINHPKCFETPTGEIILTNQSASEINTVVWNSELSGPAIDSLYAGNYTYILTDANGCTADGQIVLNDPPELMLIVFLNPEVDGEDGSIFITVFGGTPPYAITINGEEADFANHNLAGGSYLVGVFDANGCTAEYQAKLESTLSTESIERRGLSVYPNPTSGPLNISGDRISGECRLIDSNGRICLTSKRDIKTIDLSHLSAGVYSLQCQMAENSDVATIMVVKK